MVPFISTLHIYITKFHTLQITFPYYENDSDFDIHPSYFFLNFNSDLSHCFQYFTKKKTYTNLFDKFCFFFTRNVFLFYDTIYDHIVHQSSLFGFPFFLHTTFHNFFLLILTVFPSTIEHCNE